MLQMATAEMSYSNLGPGYILKALTHQQQQRKHAMWWLKRRLMSVALDFLTLSFHFLLMWNNGGRKMKKLLKQRSSVQKVQVQLNEGPLQPDRRLKAIGLLKVQPCWLASASVSVQMKQTCKLDIRVETWVSEKLKLLQLFRRCLFSLFVPRWASGARTSRPTNDTIFRFLRVKQKWVHSLFSSYCLFILSIIAP